MTPLSGSQGEMFDQTFDSFKDHCSGSRLSTRLHVTETLRDAYPDYHVTCVQRSDYDFLGFAKQGHAIAQLHPIIENRNRIRLDATRGFEKPSRLVQDASGTLENDVYFGQYSYKWDGKNYILYKTKWNTTCWGQEEKLYFVLSLLSQTTIEGGYCSSTDALLLSVGKWSSIPHEEIYVFDQTYWQKSAELWSSIKGSSWDDVILEPKMKQSLIEDVQGFFESRQLYQQFAVPWKRGIILHGVPGNGKTASIKALINYLSERPDPIPSLYVKSLENKCDGPQACVRDIFEHARKMAPCLLVFEDLDSLITKEVRSYFLNEVDGLESNDGILMIGSTNHLNSLDPAIAKRPSRFDRKYHFKIPSHSERVAYCDYWRTKLAKNESVDFSSDISPIIATLTEGFSFAYLKELFVMALLIVARGGKGLDEAENGWDVVSDNSGTPAEAASEELAATASAGEEPSKEESENVKKPKVSREIPVVDIPENLKDNVLLRVIQQQVKVLLHEMDNTEEEENVLPLLSGDGTTDDGTASACNGFCAKLSGVMRQARKAAL
ncbi:proteasome-activating nucleotidase [Tothia fuscella]|uniref:Proteasome-activating nucleotidase n=1 Tax=Tothia fuscella TaxID=1048955 RepID=A0A9P4NRS1_9PEZI|nr:proteasome-activating nucleotidase [Tothia fuscella]